MKKLAIGVGLGVVTLMGAGSALAAPFASHGSLAVGVERVFGVDYLHQTTKAPGSTVENELSATSIAFLGTRPETVSLMPQLNFDVFLGPGVSVGGGMMYQHTGANRPATSQTLSTADGSASYFLFAPRVGFGIAFNDILALWPRWGVSYYYVKTDITTTDITLKRTAGMWFTTLDTLLLISPVPHVAFNVGPSLDVLIANPTVTQDGVGVAAGDTSQYSIGLRTGLTVWF